MGYPIHIDTSIELSILYFKGLLVKTFIKWCSSVPEDEQTVPYVAFHLGLHYLWKYLFTGIQNEKGQRVDMHKAS